MGIFRKLALRYSETKEHNTLLSLAKDLISHLDDDQAARLLILKVNELDEQATILSNYKIRYQLMVEEMVGVWNSTNLNDQVACVIIGPLANKESITYMSVLNYTFSIVHGPSSSVLLSEAFEFRHSVNVDKEVIYRKIFNELIYSSIGDRVRFYLEQVRLEKAKQEEETLKLRRKAAELDRMMERETQNWLANLNEPKVVPTHRDYSIPYSPHIGGAHSIWLSMDHYKDMNTCPISGRLYPRFLSSAFTHEMHYSNYVMHQSLAEWQRDRNEYLAYQRAEEAKKQKVVKQYKVIDSSGNVVPPHDPLDWQWGSISEVHNLSEHGLQQYHVRADEIEQYERDSYKGLTFDDDLSQWQ